MKECPACGRIFEDDGDECPDDETPLVAMGESDPLVGTLAGNYRIVRCIGRGGMGTVYEATQPDIGSAVAIKTLHRRFVADSVVVERFFDEARAVNLIGHDNIVRIFDLARLPDGTPYFVMELLRGKPLSELCGKPRAVGEIVPLFLQLASALRATHGAGIVHRDLKPENVFLADSSDGPRVKVLDFGIAKLARPPGTRRTRTGAILGSARYLSPEQAAGEAAGPASDIYSTGVMLFELLTGRPLFDAATYGDLLIAHRTHAAPRVKSIVPDAPAHLDALVAQCLEKKPEARPASMEAFAIALRDAPSAPRLANRRIVWAAVAGVAAIGVVIAAQPRPAPLPAAPVPATISIPAKAFVAPVVLAPVPAAKVETDAGVPIHVERELAEPKFTIPERVGDGMIDVEW